MTSMDGATATKTSAAYLGMVVLALVTLVSAFAVPLFTPALALGGIVASIRLPRGGAGAMRWLPLAIFTIALVTALAIDLGLLAAGSGIVGVGPADAPAN